MIKEISIIIPCEEKRIPLLLKTLETYEKLETEKVEFIIVSRTITKKPHKLINKIINYEYKEKMFNPCKALNTGVKNSTHENIIITCPEVKPITNVIKQFRELGRGNYVAQVYDENEKGERTISLVNKKFRGENPGMYFLAMYRKEDIETINGWDNAFIGLYGYEDNDFGERFVRAKLPYLIKEEIQATHQWHPRGTLCPELTKAKELYNSNNSNKIIRPTNGLEQTT